jgi:hypothetical protein
MRRFTVVVLLLAFALNLSLAAPASAESPLPRWHHQTILESEHGVGGVAIGDVLPEIPGNEVVAVNSAGEIWLIAHTEDDGWQTRRLHTAGGELIMCAVGDVDPSLPGNEIVAVGMVHGPESRTGQGQVVVVGRHGDDWQATAAFVDSHMIHGVAIGDVSTAYEGNEIIACGFNHRVTLLHRSRGMDEPWMHEVIYVGNDRMKIATVQDVLPDHPGPEVVVGGSDGRVVLLHEGDLGWVHRVLLAESAGQSRVAAGDSTVLAGGDDGKVALLALRDGTWSDDVIGRDGRKIRGVTLLDVTGDDRAEAFCAGYTGHVTMLRRDADGCWSATVIYEDARPLHHLVAGELDATSPGAELVTCGHSGRVVLIRRP